METLMIIVLCNNYEIAKDSYLAFKNHILYTEPWTIAKSFDACNCLETDENLRFIFIDYHFQKAFDDFPSDVMWVDEFFEDLLDPDNILEEVCNFYGWEY